MKTCGYDRGNVQLVFQFFFSQLRCRRVLCGKVIPTPAKIDNNCYYNSGGQYASDINSTGRTWAQHQAAGFDVYGINANPLFINNFADLHLQSSSPCRNIESDLSSYFTTDMGGVIGPIGA